MNQGHSYKQTKAMKKQGAKPRAVSVCRIKSVLGGGDAVVDQAFCVPWLTVPCSGPMSADCCLAQDLLCKERNLNSE